MYMSNFGSAWPGVVDFPASGREWRLAGLPAPGGYQAAVAMARGGDLQVLAPEELPFRI